jgi:hypothetical protein
MNKPILIVGAIFLATAAAGSAQDASQAQPQQDNSVYQGQSHPPSDDVIITTEIPAPKPPAGKPMVDAAAAAGQVSVQVNAQPMAPVPAPGQYSSQYQNQSQAYIPQPSSPQPSSPQPSSIDPSVNYPAPQAMDGTDDGIVHIAPSMPQNAPMLNQRVYAADPDGDIVHPRPLRPGELQEGTSIRVHLLNRLSTADTERGEPFRSTVASDVMQGGLVLIPAGTEIDGHVAQVSSGQFGGHGTMRLQPESVVLPDGSRFQLHADVTGTYGSRTHVGGEGTIRPDSRAKRDGIEYGGAVGAGVVTGAIVAGPVGALTGGLIGAGAITVHLLVSHPQATLEPGTVLVFQLTDPLFLSPAPVSGN